MDATFAGIYLHSCEQLGHGVAGVGVEGGVRWCDRCSVQGFMGTGLSP
jgi:hypothetical protein